MNGYVHVVPEGSGTLVAALSRRRTGKISEGLIVDRFKDDRRASSRPAVIASILALCLLGLFSATPSRAEASISSGGAHSCALESAAVKCWGSNDYGQLGDGTGLPAFAPVDVQGLGSNVTAVSAGAEHSCAIVNGGAKCWGDNYYGQLGDGTSANSTTPVEVQGLSDGVTAIAAGHRHSCAIVYDVVKCWGGFSEGTMADLPTPIEVPGLGSGASAISAGSYYACAIVNGGAKCWGSNYYGQLGNGHTSTVISPVADVQGLSSGVTAISAGTNHTCAVAGGAAKCWGYNVYGMLGDGTTTLSASPVDVQGLGSGVTTISTSWAHSCAVVNGAAKCWGLNGGALGNGSTATSYTPVDVQGLTSGVTDISAGSYFSCAIVSAAAECWGANYTGQLGNGTTDNSSIPVLVGADSVAPVVTVTPPTSPTNSAASQNIAFTATDDSGIAGVVCDLNGAAPTSCTSPFASGTLAEGVNTITVTATDNAGNVATATTTITLDTELPVVSITPPTSPTNLLADQYINFSATDNLAIASVECQVDGGGYFACATGISLTPGKTLDVRATDMASNAATESVSIVLDTTPPVVSITPPTGLASQAISFSAIDSSGIATIDCKIDDGFFATCASPVNLSSGQTLYVRARDNAENTATESVAIGYTGISAGTAHSCAIAGGAAKCWGEGFHGQLGNAANSAFNSPQSVQGLTAGVTAISAGGYHNCAIVNGAAKCWGINLSGQLGNGSIPNSNIPTAVQGLSTGVTEIAAGDYHSCAVVNGGAMCWGNNGSGQLGNASETYTDIPVAVQGLSSGVTSIAVGTDHTCAVASGAAKCWGYNGYGALGTGSSVNSSIPVNVTGLTSGVTEVTAGAAHVCAIVASEAKCWGNNGGGRLGDGSNTGSNIPVSVVGLTAVTAISAGTAHTCAINSGAAMCWGYNFDHQLGTGSNTNSDVPVGVVDLGSGVTALSAGDAHSCAIVNGAAARCWGRNNSGQIGDGTSATATTPAFVSSESVPPTLALSPAPDELTNSSAGQLISFSASDASGIAGVTCQVGSATAAECTSPFATGALAEGTNTITVVATDNAGNVATSSTSIVLETTPPTLTITPPTGTLSSQNISFSASDASGVASTDCKIDQGAYASCASPISLAPGQTLLVKATDTAGNSTVRSTSIGFSAISAGVLHTCAIVSGGATCWGSNQFGRLGNLGSSSNTPVNVQGLSSGVTAISAGYYHSCAVVNGAAECWGYNNNGRLGNGSTVNSFVPVDVQGLSSGVTAIATGFTHSCAVVNGAAKCWGFNDSGQLGDGSLNGSTVPVDVQGLSSGVTAISVGYYHSCAIVNDAAKCWGSNSNGRLGDVTGNDSTIPVNVQELSSGVTALSAGGYHACALAAGVPKCWGEGYWGQLGDGNSTASRVPVVVQGISSGVASLSAGANHTCASVNGAAQCWGRNQNGQLGDGSTVEASVPVGVQGLTSGVATMSAGADHSCAIVGGAAKCWGRNLSGQLGNATNTNTLTPVSVRSESVPPTLAVSPAPDPLTNSAAGQQITFTATDASGIASVTCQLNSATASSCSSPFATGTLAEGVNTITVAATDNAGNVATASTSIVLDSIPPEVTITPPTASISNQDISFITSDGFGVATVECRIDDGSFSTCASPVNLASGHTLYVRATDDAGNTTTESVAIGFTAIEGGDFHTCAIVSGGAKCWGDGYFGQLGNASTASSNTPVDVQDLSAGVTAISAGGNHSCAIVSDAAKCWGNNSFGALGNSSNTDSSIAVDVQGLSSGVTAISAGYSHTCAIVSGAAKCWGANFNGQLGNASTTASNIPVDVQGLSSGVTAISAGDQHTCAIVGGAAKCWGNNYSGQLGNASTASSSIPVDVQGLSSGVTALSAGTSHACAIAGGAAKCWGNNSSGQLGNASSIDSSIPTDVEGLSSGVTAISGGINHTCAIVSAAAKCWGENGKGQLGDDSTDNSDTPVDVVGLLFGVTKISAGGSHSCAIALGTASCWGDNESGQFGDATNSGSTTPVPVRSESVPPTLDVSPAPVPLTNSGVSQEITFTATDDSGITSVTCQVGAAAATSCSSPFSTGTLAEGTNTITVVATDTVGNVATGSTSIVLDTELPVVTITPPTSPTNSSAPQDIDFTATDNLAVASIECKIDAGAFTNCTSPSSLSAGETLTVRATDTAGNQATASTTIVADTTAPVVSIAPPTSPTNSSAAQDVAFTATDASGIASVTCQLGSAAATSCSSPFSTGTLAQGANLITVVATDNAGNAATATATITLDTTPPVVTITPPASPTNSAASKNVAFTATDASGIAGVLCDLNSATPVACTSSFPTGTLTEGDNTATVVATDNAGNVATAMATISLDTELPVVTITSPTSPTNSPAAQSIGFTATDNLAIASAECKTDAGAFTICTSPVTLAAGSTLTLRATDTAGNEATASTTIVADTTAPVVSITSPTSPTNSAASNDVAFTATDASGIAGVTCQLGAAAATSCSSPFSTGTLAQGANLITVVATDNAGNAATATTTITLDTTPPVVSITPPTSPTNSPSDQSISFTATDNLAIASVECKTDAGAFAACTSPATLAPGETLSVRATDTAGNEATASTAIIADTTVPVVSITPPTSPTNSAASKNVAFTATDASGIAGVTCRLGAAAATSCSSPFSTGTLAEGANAITIVATDNAGNTSTASVSITLDTGLPVVTIQAPATALASLESTSITFSATDTNGVASTTCSLNGSPAESCTSPFVTGPLTEGTNTITVVAVDTLGNVGSSTASFVANKPQQPSPPQPVPQTPIIGIVESKNPLMIAGTAGPAGKVAKVQVALRRVDGNLRRRQGRCIWFTGRPAAMKPRSYKKRAGSCRTLRFVTAIGTEKWSVTLAKALKPGRYHRYIRVTLVDGTVTKRFTTKDNTYKKFRVTLKRP